jgi:glutamyl-tRNA reductase
LGDWPFTVVTADYRTASTEWRSRLELVASARTSLATELRGQAVMGFAQVATCNRTLWAAACAKPTWAGQLLRAQALERWSSYPQSPADVQVYVGRAAAEHVLRVAAGLESFARGERQIAGQVHRSFENAKRENTSCAPLNLLATAIGRTVARTSSIRDFGSRKTGVHGEVLAVLSESLTSNQRTIAVVGLGVIGRRVADTFHAAGWQVHRVNRTAGPDIHPLDDLHTVAATCDALVVATGAPYPVVTSLPTSGRVRIVVDIGSPAQVQLDACLNGATVVDLNGLLARRARTGSSAGVDAAEQAVADGLAELRAALEKHRHRALMHESRVLYQSLAWKQLPAVLDRHGLTDGTPGRSALESDLRTLLQQHVRGMVDALSSVEDTSL